MSQFGVHHKVLSSSATGAPSRPRLPDEVGERRTWSIVILSKAKDLLLPHQPHACLASFSRRDTAKSFRLSSNYFYGRFRMPRLQEVEGSRNPRPRCMDVLSLPQRSQTEALREGKAEAPERRNGSVPASSQSTPGSRKDVSSLHVQVKGHSLQVFSAPPALHAWHRAPGRT
jgi:hypothetical protein